MDVLPQGCAAVHLGSETDSMLWSGALVLILTFSESSKPAGQTCGMTGLTSLGLSSHRSNVRSGRILKTYLTL